MPSRTRSRKRGLPVTDSGAVPKQMSYSHALPVMYQRRRLLTCLGNRLQPSTLNTSAEPIERTSRPPAPRNDHSSPHCLIHGSLSVARASPVTQSHREECIPKRRRGLSTTTTATTIATAHSPSEDISYAYHHEFNWYLPSCCRRRPALTPLAPQSFPLTPVLTVMSFRPHPLSLAPPLFPPGHAALIGLRHRLTAPLPAHFTSTTAVHLRRRRAVHHETTK